MPTMNAMHKAKHREKGRRWCQVDLKLENGRLSITGCEGSIIGQANARKQAREYWESFFEDSPAEIIEMNKRCGSRCHNARQAARFVLATDGEFHGLDVHQDDGKHVYITESCGQIRETILEFFPELAPILPWHLNDMHAECEHQQARGETYAANPGAECPDCGYHLGSAWTKRALPPEVIRFVEAF